MTRPPPLRGIRVLELAGLAPAPFCGMVLADFGADVVRLDPVTARVSIDQLARGKRSIAVSLKEPAGLALVKSLLTPARFFQPGRWRADVLIDPFRPGVLERLGLDPDELMRTNPKLIVVRITGFRREGPYAKMAGHDINYSALSGVLHLLGRKGENPTPPINLLADFAGGGMFAALGAVLAILERQTSGKGQVVEADMLTGARYVSSFVLNAHRTSKGGQYRGFSQPRGENLLDTGAPFYDVYETKDGGYMSLGALEPQFYRAFLQIIIQSVPQKTVPDPLPAPATQNDVSTWPALRAFFTAAFRTRTRDDWAAIFIGTDACCVPVLTPNEVDSHGRGTLIEGATTRDGSAAAPTPHLVGSPAPPPATEGTEGYSIVPGRDTEEVLRQAGVSTSALKELSRNGAIRLEEAKSKL